MHAVLEDLISAHIPSIVRTQIILNWSLKHETSRGAKHTGNAKSRECIANCQPMITVGGNMEKHSHKCQEAREQSANSVIRDNIRIKYQIN